MCTRKVPDTNSTGWETSGKCIKASKEFISMSVISGKCISSRPVHQSHMASTVAGYGEFDGETL